MKEIRTPLTGTPLTLPPACQPRGNAQDMPAHPADELAYIRAELRRLHAREDELKRHYRENPEAFDLSGRKHAVTITRHSKRVFDHTLLPQAILANPKFYRTEACTLITSSLVASYLPFQASLPGIEPSEVEDIETFELIEQLPN